MFQGPKPKGGMATAAEHPVAARQETVLASDQLTTFRQLSETLSSARVTDAGTATQPLEATTKAIRGLTADVAQTNFTLVGYVVRRRKLSRKLMFYDIIEKPDTQTGASITCSAPCLELIIKYPTVSLHDVAEINRRVILGDLVRVSGSPEITTDGAVLLHAIDIVSLQHHPAWGVLSDNNPHNPPPTDPTEAFAVSHTSGSASDKHGSGEGALTQQGNDGARKKQKTGEESNGTPCIAGKDTSTSLHASTEEAKQRRTDECRQGTPDYVMVERYIKKLLGGAPKNLLACTHDEGGGFGKGMVSREPEMCSRHWQGGCDKKDEGCPFRHYYLSDKEENRFARMRAKLATQLTRAQKIQKISQETQGGGNIEVSGQRKPKEGVYAHGLRADVFVEWLVAKFGDELIRAGTGVLDVAGGRGCVSFELMTKRNIPCTLIDPRPIKLNKSQHKFLKKQAKKISSAYAGHGIEGLVDSAPYQTPAALTSADSARMASPRLVSQCRTWFDNEFISGTKAIVVSPTPNPHSLSPKVHTEKKDAGSSESTTTDTPSTTACVSDLARDIHSLELLETCSLLVGMHPDQATEPIVNAALKYNKPFAVVPCCVFPNLFPDRKLRDGTEVVQYEQFVQYLCEKAEGVRVDFLPVEGRNQVVYRL